MFDYVHIGASGGSYNYILVMCDKFSKVVELWPAVAPTALEASRAILWWSSRYGLPDWLLGDGGTHFRNAALEQLATLDRMEHHITLVGKRCDRSGGPRSALGAPLRPL